MYGEVTTKYLAMQTSHKKPRMFNNPCYCYEKYVKTNLMNKEAPTTNKWKEMYESEFIANLIDF